jgi:hypothetical protein
MADDSNAGQGQALLLLNFGLLLLLLVCGGAKCLLRGR